MRVLTVLSSSPRLQRSCGGSSEVLIRRRSGVWMQVGTHPCAVAALIPGGQVEGQAGVRVRLGSGVMFDSAEKVFCQK